MSVMPPNLSIKQWEPDDRPREKLKEKGAESLSLAELLAIIIGSGSPGESAVELMKRILYHQRNGLLGLEHISFQRLTKFKGVRMVKAIKIKAALEISKRLQNQAYPKKNNLLPVHWYLSFWFPFCVTSNTKNFGFYI